jgi:hypothetical protein
LLDTWPQAQTIMALRSLLTAALVIPTALCKPTALKSRAVIDHDKVVGFAEAVPDNSEGDLMLAYKPYLKVFNGCVPFPAVDAEGNTS